MTHLINSGRPGVTSVIADIERAVVDAVTVDTGVVRFRATGFPGTNYSICWDPLQHLECMTSESESIIYLSGLKTDRRRPGDRAYKSLWRRRERDMSRNDRCAEEAACSASTQSVSHERDSVLIHDSGLAPH